MKSAGVPPEMVTVHGNNKSLGELTRDEWVSMLNGAFYYVAAGGAAGIVRSVLTRSAAERSLAIEEAARHYRTLAEANPGAFMPVED